MLVRVHQLFLSLDFDDSELFKAVAAKLGCSLEDMISVEIYRQAVDARRGRSEIKFSITADVELARDLALPESPDICEVPEIEPYTLPEINPPAHRPVVVGAGPAGLMAGLTLAQAGANPIILERGKAADQRARDVSLFWQDGSLDTQSNALYGEGGAGLFSDGKLTTRSKDKLGVQRFLEVLFECGAPEEILYQANPHLGTDVMKVIIPRLRQRIIEAGGEFKFSAVMSKLIMDGEKIAGVEYVCNGVTHTLETQAVFLATGHSARDVYKSIHASGVAMSPKGFAVGVRAELLQEQVDRSQYDKSAGHPKLGAASFRLTSPSADNRRACYTFCMCPGGEVISCASTAGELTTNGMSNFSRNGFYANVAFLVPVGPDDFPTDSEEFPGVLAGCEYQRRIETAAFKAGGCDYSLPACMFWDFIDTRVSKSLPDDRSCSRAVAAEFRDILPEPVWGTLVQSMGPMLKRMRGVDLRDVLLYAAETRSSSPVRIDRGNDDRQSTNIAGLYPLGEGSGYAGGIVSSAIDGSRGAEAYLQSIAK